MFDFFGTADLGVDLGTGFTRMAVVGEGLVLEEASVVVRSRRNGNIIAVGDKACPMLGRVPEEWEAVRPLRNGVIADFDLTKIMLRSYLKRILGKRFFSRPRLVLSTFSGVTSVERRAVLDAATEAGAREAYLLDAPLAAALGAGVDVKGTPGTLVVHMGAGSVEAAVFCLGRIALVRCLRQGGEALDWALAQYLRKNYNLVVGNNRAEQAKIEIGTVWESNPPASMEIKGKNLLTGMPAAVNLNQNQMREAFQGPVQSMLELVRSVLEDLDGELLTAVKEQGILLTGGCAQLRNFDSLLNWASGLRVHVAENAPHCAVRGTAMAAENMNAFRRSGYTRQSE